MRTLDAGELSRALGAATRALVSELRSTDSGIAGTLEKPLLDLSTVS